MILQILEISVVLYFYVTLREHVAEQLGAIIVGHRGNVVNHDLIRLYGSVIIFRSVTVICDEIDMMIKDRRRVII